jgi:hypothetical protein
MILRRCAKMQDRLSADSRNPSGINSYTLQTRNRVKINVMKISRVLYVLSILIVCSGFYGCNAEKQTAQRRNLMIPQKDELPRNSRYTGVKKRKTTKQKKKKNNRRRGYTQHIYYFPIDRYRA